MSNDSAENADYHEKTLQGQIRVTQFWNHHVYGKTSAASSKGYRTPYHLQEEGEALQGPAPGFVLVPDTLAEVLEQ